MTKSNALARAAVLALFTLTACASPEAGAAESALFGSGWYTKTKYPIVLMHGMIGFEDLLGIVEYWPGIPEALADGGAQVFVMETYPLHDSTARAEAVIPQIEEVLAITGARKVNIFGHSQGSIDARYIAAVRPDIVASVTSIGGPHKGAPMADAVLGGGLGTLDEAALEIVGDLFVLLAGSDWDNDVTASMTQLSVAYMTNTFNRRFPAAVPTTACGAGAAQANGIRYYSWGGTEVTTDALDPSDLFLAIATAWIPGNEDDGLVGRCSSHLGDVIRDDYYQNHLDETNLLFGIVDSWHVQPETLYRQQANRLRTAGL